MTQWDNIEQMNRPRRNLSAQVGWRLFGVFATPCLIALYLSIYQHSTKDLITSLTLLLAAAIIGTSIRWQCRICETIKAARTAWQNNAHIDT